MTKTTARAAKAAPAIPAAFAIDVGFGSTKLSHLKPDGTLGYMHFPSMAIPSDPSAMRQLSQRNRDTFDVPVGTSMYEVGRDIELAQTGGDFGREITDEFYRGPIYEALTKGALRYMGREHIDLLVLGLPVNQYQNTDRHQFLSERFKGEIDLGGGHKVTVKDVLVRPQPLGGYMELANNIDGLNEVIVKTSGAQKAIEKDEDLLGLTVLMVDPGEHTLDWLLIRRGQINTKASGAASDAGRHRVVRAVQEALQAQIGRPLGPATMPLINEALRLRKPLKLSGVLHDLGEFDGVVRAAVEDPINRLIEGVRGMHEVIDIVAIVGGHPTLYREVLASRFPAIPVYVLADSITANVRGFQTIAEELSSRAGEPVVEELAAA